MAAMRSVRFPVVALVIATGALAPACDIFTALGGGETLRCTRDDSCPEAMACLAGRCLRVDASATIVDGGARDRTAADGSVRPDAYRDGGSPDNRADVVVGDHPPSDLPATPDAATSDALQVVDAAPADAQPADAGWCQPNCIAQIVAGGICPTENDCSCHTCTLLRNGTVKCWGRNNYGQLGLGDKVDRGDGPGEVGDNLPPISLGTGRKAVDVTIGSNFACALLDNATVKCWGMSGYGNLGLGDNVFRGDNDGEMGNALPAVNVGSGHTAQAVAAGGRYACAVLDDATVKCWGDNPYGQLGIGDINPRGNAPSEMGDLLPTVDLALGGGRVRQIAASAVHNCVLIAPDVVKCWGNNQYGHLGLGDTRQRGDDPGEMGAALPEVELGL